MFDSIVTGAAGFIGSHLSERLLARGDRVLGVDSFDSYYAASFKRGNLSGILSHPRFTLIRGDARGSRIRSHVDGVARVFHLAGQPGVRGSWGTRFGRYVDNNVRLTQSLLETIAKARSRPRFVYASSSSVYGIQPEGPTSELALPSPISPYGVSKLAGEHLVRLYAWVHRLSTVSLRFFTVYGPRQRPDMAFFRFLKAAATGREIPVHGRGRQLRDFTYIDDIVGGIVSGGELDFDGDVFNLGRGSPVRLEDSLKLVGEVTGRPLRLKYVADPPGNPKSTWADVTRARRVLGFRPRIDLRTGLMNQWAWQRGMLFGEVRPAPTTSAR